MGELLVTRWIICLFIGVLVRIDSDGHFALITLLPRITGIVIRESFYGGVGHSTWLRYCAGISLRLPGRIRSNVNIRMAGMRGCGDVRSVCECICLSIRFPSSWYIYFM